ncbi:MAG: MFS transporter, partial [Alphaproteobacteria bacterium]|nr:MFS transporter [Alphaproteobacteria bacterium]
MNRSAADETAEKALSSAETSAGSEAEHVTPQQPSVAALEETETVVRPGALAPFRSPIFLAMWVASVVSYFGGLIQSVGAAWLMTALAPAADMVALVQVSTVLPIVLFSLLAGAAADVCDRRVVMLAAQASMLAVSAALAGLAWAGWVTPWTLLSLTFLLGSGNALYGPAWQSSVREQVKAADLPAAVSLNSAAFNLARAAGPALGGVLVAWAG